MMVETTTTFESVHQCIAKHSPGRDALLTGRLGLCIYYLEVFQTTGNPADAELGISHLETVFEHWNTGSTTLKGNAYSYGGAGLGYVATLFKSAGLVEIDMMREFKELDAYLFQSALEQIINDGDIDPLHGAMGVLHYFNSRGEEPCIRGYIESMVHALSIRIVDTKNGIWINNNSFEKKPQINFSLSHGLCGYLSILLDTYQLGICTGKIEKWVTSGVQHLLHYYRQPNFSQENFQQFPALISLAGEPTPMFTNRLAWCYGDLNVVGLLYKAAKILGNKKWQQLADEYGIVTTTRKLSQHTSVTDAHFCHGAAGLATYYQTLYSTIKLDAYKSAFLFWQNQTKSYIDKELDNGFYTGKEANLLEGLPGIGLSLIGNTDFPKTFWPSSLFL
jgi:lantibiotic biosynthesis protein